MQIRKWHGGSIEMVIEQNQPGYQIRIATSADNVLLAEIGAESFYDSFAAQNTVENMSAYLANSFSPAIQARELSDPASRFLIIENGNTSVGYARLKFGPTPEVISGKNPMEIARFYARKEWIGKGVGPRLMQACLEQARQSGCDVIWLDVWENNPRAITFYHKWGFEVVGSQTFKLGDDLQHDLLMARNS